MVAFCVIVIVFFVLVVVIAWSMWRSLWDTQFAKRLKEQCVGVMPATAGVASSAAGSAAGAGAVSSAAGASAAGAGGSAPDADMGGTAGDVVAGGTGGSSASEGGPAQHKFYEISRASGSKDLLKVAAGGDPDAKDLMKQEHMKKIAERSSRFRWSSSGRWVLESVLSFRRGLKSRRRSGQD